MWSKWSLWRTRVHLYLQTKRQRHQQQLWTKVWPKFYARERYRSQHLFFQWNQRRHESQEYISPQTSKGNNFNQKDGHYCQTVASSSLAPITAFTKPGWNMIGITRPLVGRIKRWITDKLGCCRCFILLEKDNYEILILTAYLKIHYPATILYMHNK